MSLREAAARLQTDRAALVARHVIRRALALASTPEVAFSAGKDSTVLAHLVHSVDPTVPWRISTFGETRLVHSDLDEMLDWARRLGACVIEDRQDYVFDGRDLSWWDQLDWGVPVECVRELNSPGVDLVFLGLRREESAKRRRALSMYRTPGYPPWTYRYKGEPKLIRCAPLATWKTSDIEAYILREKLPTLRAYRSAMGMEARTSARLDLISVNKGALRDLRRRDPASWARLMQRFPELKAEG